VLDKIIEKFWFRNELPKNDDRFIVNDDTQVGIEFAIEQINIANEGKQLISENAISYLFDNHPEVYKEFYERIDT
jgi:hypothetical protein